LEVHMSQLKLASFCFISIVIVAPCLAADINPIACRPRGSAIAA
jgi:hypothetical protein